MIKGMLSRMVGGAALLAVVFAAAGARPVQAQTAYQTRFVTSVTYQNVGSTPAEITFQFFAKGSGTSIEINLPPLAANAGTSLAVGGRQELPANFEGAGVLLSTGPVVATMVQVPQNSPVRNRPLSNGFSGNEAAAQFQIPTVLKNTFNTTTRFAVQNVDSAAANIEIKFVNAAAGSVGQVTHTLNIANLPANSVQYVDAGTITQLGNSFNGSALITATRVGGGDGKVVASAVELSINGTGVSSFEGSPGGAGGGSNTVYMPSAVCNAFGGQQTAYAIQNVDAPGSTGAQNANVTVTYTYKPASGPGSGATDPFQTATFTTVIAPGAKASVLGCTSNLPANSNGSAVITSTGAKIVAVGKVTGAGSTAGVTTASPGASAGADKLALPYVRWTQTAFVLGGRQRTFIAIQNVGDANLPAGAVRVNYYDRNGNLVGTHNLPAIPRNAKVNSTPLDIGAAGNEFGFDPATNSFGGSAIVEGPTGSKLVAIARVSSNLNNAQTPQILVSEDYNGIPINP